jgi:cis-3-alkyl-4-acyloxetan-2-one decarboxylase
MRLFDSIWHKWLKRPYPLVVSTEGQGRPLVLLHGLSARRVDWKPLLKLLDPDLWRVTAPDLLGFGESPKPTWSNYGVQEHAKTVVAALKKQKVETPFTLVGHSMGCLVATHIAAQYPKLVSRLILYQPPLFADAPDYPAHAKKRQKYFALFEYIASHPQLVATHSHRLWRFARKLSRMAVRPDTWNAFERSLRNTIMQQRAYDELHAIQIPTDIIYGRLDFVVIRTDVQRMFRRNKHITLHLVNEMHNITPRAARYIAKLLG